MTQDNYEDLVKAIEHVSTGLEHLASLALDLKHQVEKLGEDERSIVSTH